MIMLPQGERKKLAKEFGVTRQAVYMALNKGNNTQQAQMIRKAAIERGGVEFDPDRKRRAQ
jgi:Zn-dependent peptidase ImmA (M78 family)